jgi:sterol desaturase/sphingolipid hydroxylase (fatty acid hydroxylase superfamily)
MVQNFFAHANIKIEGGFERRLRYVLITPEMHRVHHSVRAEEQNTNFGAILPFWDRLCGTYLAAPAESDDRLSFGLQELENRAPLTLTALLMMPFTGNRSGERAEHTGVSQAAIHRGQPPIQSG